MKFINMDIVKPKSNERPRDILGTRPINVFVTMSEKYWDVKTGSIYNSTRKYTIVINVKNKVPNKRSCLDKYLFSTFE